MSYWYDEEAVYQDADIEQMEMEEESNRLWALRAQGICIHGSAVGFSGEVHYPEQEGLKIGQLRCTDGCGTIFNDDEEWYEARMNL